METITLSHEGRIYHRNSYGNWFRMQRRDDGLYVIGNVATETHEFLDSLAAVEYTTTRADLVLNA